jgi:hypothetical protein
MCDFFMNYQSKRTVIRCLYETGYGFILAPPLSIPLQINKHISSPAGNIVPVGIC